MKILVTAGGQGTKLWPFSRESKPKQFQPLIEGKSIYQLGIESLLKQYEPEDIFISTKRKFIKYVSEQTPQIPLKNYIIEPDLAIDRGPGEGLAFLMLSIRHPDEPFFVFQSDLIREPEEAWLKTMKDAETLVRTHRKFVTGGVKATTAIMGVDYLQLGKLIPIEGSDQEAYVLDKFRFRPDTAKETRELVENFHVVTHWNHTCWFPELMLEAYRQYRPDWYGALMQIKDVLDKPGEDAAIERIYATMAKGPTEDVTRNIMDSGEAMVLLLPYRVTDFGTWQSVYDYFSDGTTNYHDGKAVSVDSEGSLIRTSRPDKLVALAGLDEVVVVDTDDVLIVIAKDKIDKIKDIQAELKAGDMTEYL